MSNYEENINNINDRKSDLKYLREGIQESFYKQYIELLIRSNLELQSKLSELIILNANLMKDLKTLIDIFKEAALERKLASKYERTQKSEEPKKEKSKKEENKEENNNSNIEKKFDEISKANLKMLEILSEIENFIKQNKNIDQNKNNIFEKKINNNNFLFQQNNLPNINRNNILTNLQKKDNIQGIKK